jgi:ATP-dependent Clp protease adapter protein ClpS
MTHLLFLAVLLMALASVASYAPMPLPTLRLSTAFISRSAVATSPLPQSILSLGSGCPYRSSSSISSPLGPLYSSLDLDSLTKSTSKVRIKDRESTESKQKENVISDTPWRVLLHNDEIHTFDYVTQSIVKIIKQLTRKKAHEITVQTHSAGQATVIVVWKELAETYCMGLQRQGLTASIAPDSGFKGGKDGEGGDGDGDGSGDGGGAE